MAEKAKRYFKIRCKVTGLYSKGWSYCSPAFKDLNGKWDRNGFSVNGKIWTGTGPLRNHLNLAIRRDVNVDDFEIIECELTEKESVPISDYCNIMNILKRT